MPQDKSLYILLILLFASNLCAQENTFIVFDMPCSDSLPVHFRKSNGEFKISAETFTDTTGLALLNASGSAEFCSQSLKVMLKNIGRDKIIIVDLRQESHGFVNGTCISWSGFGNVGFSQMEIEADETRRLDSIFKAKDISVPSMSKEGKVIESSKIPLTVTSVQTEKELTGQFNAGYFRIAITDRQKPQNEDADRLIEFVNALDNSVWLHFHCQAGYGRTTTFLAMYDMMRNSKNVSLQEILLRQYFLGGIDLTRIEDMPGVEKKDAIELKKFLRDFYNYCRDNKDNFITSFSVWSDNKRD